MKRAFVLSVLLLLMVGCGSTPKFSRENGERTKGFVLREMESVGKTRKYSVFVPHTPPPPGGYPVILAMHGLGEGGGDGKGPTKVGIGPVINKQQESFDFLVVFPQIGGMVNWNNDRSARIAIDALDNAMRDFNGNPDRVIATGYSNGGQGAWVVGGKYPDRFAGLVPMCAYSATEYVPQLKNLPIWVWHNSLDWAVSNGHSDRMVKELRRAGANVKYTQPSSASHDVWVNAFKDQNLYAWMKQQRRR
ncbi:MAG: hypothetical protein AAGD32_17285 [Planctomycetota bacterium]